MAVAHHGHSVWTTLTSSLPAALQGRVNALWQDYRQACLDAAIPIPGHPDFLRVLHRVWAMSEFVALSCVRAPALLQDLLTSGDLLANSAPGEYTTKVAAGIAECRDETALGAALRRVRRREMLRIAWRDLAGWAELKETLSDLSAFADACVHIALQCLHAWQCAEWGAPRAHGEEQTLIVLALGKLGGEELNFSSDIDLIFTYTEDGETTRGMDNADYFQRLGQRLVNVLSAVTEDGFVFRVDLRLRPYGDSGPLVLSFDAMEQYYQQQGREWERYAFIKARLCAGDVGAGAELLQRLRPFVYRRYLDFSALRALRAMKALIVREVERKSRRDDIKSGAGGIREIEFITQVFQLIRGGREPRLQERGTLTVLAALPRLGDLSATAGDELMRAYVFLRRLENRLQAYADEQTYRLPSLPLEQARLAFAMGFATWEDCAAALAEHRRSVHTHFERIFAAAEQAEPVLHLHGLDWGMLAESTQDPAAAHAALQAAGFDPADAALRALLRLRESLAYRTSSAESRERMDELVPHVLQAALRTAQPLAALTRLLVLLEAIAGRSIYLALLLENPPALELLAKLNAASPWIAEQLSKQPLLLDELLDARRLYAPLLREPLQRELDNSLRAVAVDDMEQQLEILRRFKQTNRLRIAAANSAGLIAVTEVSAYLTTLAEVIVRQALNLAFTHLCMRHGQPYCHDRGQRRHAHFSIIAYGNFGGGELGYDSDLDLVFLHDSRGKNQRTDGTRRMDNSVFFARLGQRIIHILNAHTPGGVLYDVDMRLRPSGNSGMLVSGVDAYARYQREDAWTWEHQALVRARVVAGDESMATAFAAARARALCRPRDPDALRSDIHTMRLRMHAEQPRRLTPGFDLKQGQGGIADIEFVVQYGVLLAASREPRLLHYTDTLSLLQALQKAAVVTAQDATTLAQAYTAYRACLQHKSLQGQPTQIDAEEFATERKAVAEIFRRLLAPDAAQASTII